MAGNPPIPSNAIVSPEVDVTVAGAPSIATPTANPAGEGFQGGTTTISAAVVNIPDGSQAGLGTGPIGGPYTDTGLRTITANSTATFADVTVPGDTSATPEQVAFVVFYVPS